MNTQGDVDIEMIVPYEPDPASILGIIEKRMMTRAEFEERFQKPWPSEFPINDPRNTCGAY